MNEKPSLAIAPLLLALGIALSPLSAQDRGLEIVAREVVGSPGFQVGRQYAVIIGIDRYQQWPALRNAVSDAKEIKRILAERYYIDQFYELYDQEATAGNIRRLFSTTLPQALGINDSLLVFYSGHGYLDSSKTGFWIAADGVTDLDDQKGWVSNSQIRNYIGQFKAQRILVISDSCFSGDFLDLTRGAMPTIDTAYYQKALQRTARQVLTSGASEAVPDSSEFARQLASALERNGESVLDPYSIYDRVRLGVTRTSPLLGNLPGHEQGACFALFLRDAGARPPSRASPPAAAPREASAPPARSESQEASARLPQAALGAAPQRSKEVVGFMLQEKDYLKQAKREELKSFSSLLTASERLELYEKYKAKSFWPAVGNTFYGLGSWLQGDYLGGALVTGTMVLGLIMVSATPASTSTASTQTSGTQSVNPGVWLLTGGMIYGWIQPSIFAAKRNKEIRSALMF